ncbi:MAG: LysR family transcriptional regulator [Sphingomonas sanxanigenens]|uniref:LysR family transcriptional regulator n=1 Tax=Sphingomonas sanxanigenens TaxID=397260 RepID=A0A2W5A9V7_9SPHN|nr:MAG: LysR family transcriptional regulator [Sphingomonas sanxanigenens]
MRQDQFDGLAAFISVAEEGGFTAAAMRLGVSASAVSQAIRALEARLGAPLFNRTTRSVHLTEAGAQYLARIRPAVGEISMATEELGRGADEPSGLLRITVARSAYMILLQPILRRFMAAHPAIELEVSINNQLVDIVAGGFDAGIRFGDTVERDMVAVKVGPPIAAHIVAAPDYLGRRGIPRCPDELAGHDCIRLRNGRGEVERWEFVREGELFEIAVPGRLILNDFAAMVQAAIDGLGITYMINGYIERFIDDGRLVRLLADWSPTMSPLTLYYPDRRRVPPKLRALIDFMRADPSPRGPAEAMLS